MGLQIRSRGKGLVRHIAVLERGIQPHIGLNCSNGGGRGGNRGTLRIRESDTARSSNPGRLWHLKSALVFPVYCREWLVVM